MSRRAAIVEEFDDDTDLPLPSIPLPNTGSRGPLLQELNSDDDDDFEASQQAGPASPSRQQYQKSPLDSGSRAAQADAARQVTDITPYKSSVFFLVLSPNPILYFIYVYGFLGLI